MNIFIKESQHDSQWLERALKNEYGSALRDIYCNMESRIKSCRFVILHPRKNQNIDRKDYPKIGSASSAFEYDIKLKLSRILSSRGITNMDFTSYIQATNDGGMKQVCQLKWR